MTTQASLASPLDIPVRAHDNEDRISNALSELAGIDCHDVDLRDHPEAWKAMERFSRDERNDCMLPVFDGYRVFCALDEKAKSRTSYENVSDTLDALAKLMRSNAEITGG